MLEGGARYPDFNYPDEQYYYYAMAERFGWTPEQVDNLPAYTADWLLAIGATIDQVKAEKMENQ
jgi:hypothetical protein